ncbi:MAG: zinc ribbon domain-containing protein [Variovorax sp.]
MTLEIFTCRTCAASYFPRRMRCPACGGWDFDPQSVQTARVVAVTTANRIPPGCVFEFLVELATDSDVPVIAAASAMPTIGARVPVARDETGAVFISSLSLDATS